MQTLLTALEIIGVFSFSVSGAIMAIDKENDFLGVLFLALVTSFGGGILRDIFIGNTPPLFFKAYIPIIISTLAATAVFVLAAVFKRQYVRNEKTLEAINNYFDAVGLSVFVITGAQICIEAGQTNPFLIISMGMLSGAGGSMIRDIIMNEVPLLLQRRVYLTAAIAGAGTYCLLLFFNVNKLVAVPVSAAMIVIIRVLATVFEWNIPKAIDFSKMSDK